MTKKILGSSDYRLNISCPSGPLFGLKYDATMSYTLFNDDAATMTPAFDLGQQVVVSPTQLHHPLKKATIIDIPFKHRDTYKIKLLECNSIFDILPCDILPYDPSNQVDENSPSLPNPWFRHKACCTIFRHCSNASLNFPFSKNIFSILCAQHARINGTFHLLKFDNN